MQASLRLFKLFMLEWAEPREVGVGVCEWVSTVVACERALSECMNAIILL